MLARNTFIMKRYICTQCNLVTSRKSLRKHIMDKHLARAEFSGESKKEKKRMWLTQSRFWKTEVMQDVK